MPRNRSLRREQRSRQQRRITASVRLLAARQRVEFRLARAAGALPPSAQVRLSGRPPVRVDGQALEPEVQLTLMLLERQGDPPWETLSPEQARALVRRQSAVAGGPAPRIGSHRELSVDGAEGPLRARLYECQEPGGPHPLMVFFHGGGFVLGDLDTHDSACRLLCLHAGAHVLSVEYRLAPEHPFPAGLEDARAATRWAFEHAERLGADPERIAVAGDSAGANLATVVCLLATTEGDRVPAFQLLIYPTTDASRRRESHELFGEGYFLTVGEIDWFGDHYAAGHDDTDPRISPLLAEDLSAMPPALVVTAGFDPLRDEGEAYAAALKEAGVPVALRRFSGLIHGFINATGVSRVSRDALVEVAGATRAILATADATSRTPRAA
jgi:acetyl esterase